MDDRATSPAVGKLLAAGLVLLYVSGATTVLFGSVVPGAQRAAGEELAERIVADAAARVERALEPVDRELHGRVGLDLPATVAGSGYRLHLRDGRIALGHPDASIETAARLDLPPGVTVLESGIDGGTDGAVLVSGTRGNRTIQLVEAER